MAMFLGSAFGMWLVFGLICLVICTLLALGYAMRRLKDLQQENNQLWARLWSRRRVGTDTSQRYSIWTKYPSL